MFAEKKLDEKHWNAFKKKMKSKLSELSAQRVPYCERYAEIKDFADEAFERITGPEKVERFVPSG